MANFISNLLGKIGKKKQPVHEVTKNGVICRFEVGEEDIRDFVVNKYQGWEKNTFATFEKVRDQNGIAIDIGGWIGTTSIWLSKNFKKVISVEGDKVSVDAMKNNLSLSGCDNVEICEKPIFKVEQSVVFGPRNHKNWDRLNMSISHIKESNSSDVDYTVDSITFEQLLETYLSDEEVKDISFIKCDIEGGEEHILEDLLAFSQQNSVNLLVSFHLPWWESPNDLNKHLAMMRQFQCFNVDQPIDNVGRYLYENKWGSVLLKP